MWILPNLKQRSFLFGYGVLEEPATFILNMAELRLGNIRVINEENIDSVHENVARNWPIRITERGDVVIFTPY